MNAFPQIDLLLSLPILMVGIPWKLLFNTIFRFWRPCHPDHTEDQLLWGIWAIGSNFIVCDITCHGFERIFSEILSTILYWDVYHCLKAGDNADWFIREKPKLLIKFSSILSKKIRVCQIAKANFFLLGQFFW